MPHTQKRHANQVLTDPQVVRMRRAVKEKRKTVGDYVESTGLTYTAIYFALTGRTFKHLPKKLRSVATVGTRRK